MLPEEALAGLEALLPALERHKVDVMVIGGLAVAHYGHRRISGGPVRGEVKADLDFWYNPTTKNYFNLLLALKELGVDTAEIERRIFDPKKSFLKIPQKTFHMDFLPQVAGLSSYKNCKKNSTTMVVGNQRVTVLGFDDLLKNKRAIGRAIDRADIDALQQKRKLSRED